MPFVINAVQVGTSEYRDAISDIEGQLGIMMQEADQEIRELSDIASDDDSKLLASDLRDDYLGILPVVKNIGRLINAAAILYVNHQEEGKAIGECLRRMGLPVRK
jgi:hypothetical protein